LAEAVSQERGWLCTVRGTQAIPRTGQSVKIKEERSERTSHPADRIRCGCRARSLRDRPLRRPDVLRRCQRSRRPVNPRLHATTTLGASFSGDGRPIRNAERDGIDVHVERAVREFPEIQPHVEGIAARIERLARYRTKGGGGAVPRSARLDGTRIHGPRASQARAGPGRAKDRPTRSSGIFIELTDRAPRCSLRGIREHAVADVDPDRRRDP
jgi:hypothetical protein